MTVDTQARTAPAQTKVATNWQEMPDGTRQRIADVKGTMEPFPEEGWQLLGSTPTPLSKSVQVQSGIATEMPNGKHLSGVSRSSVTSVSPPAPAADAFALIRGRPVRAQLKAWTVRAGWTVEWDMPDGWIVPNNQPLGNDFTRAARQAIEQLTANGADVQADIWKGSQVMVVRQARVGG